MKKNVVLGSLLILSSCGQAINSTDQLKLSSNALLNRDSFSEKDIETRIYTNLSLHSIGVKKLVGENLKYNFTNQVLDAYLFATLEKALNTKNEAKYPDIFSLKIRKIPALTEEELRDETLETIDNFNNETEAVQSKLKYVGYAKTTLDSVDFVNGVVATPYQAPIAVGSYVLNKVLDHYSDSLDEDRNNLTMDFIKNNITQEDSVYLENLTPEGFNNLDRRYNFISKINEYTCKSDCTLEQKQQIQKAINQNLVQMQKGDLKRFEALKKDIDTVKSDTSTLEKKFNDTVANFEKITTALTEKVDSIGKEQISINEKLAVISKELETSRDRFDSLEKDMSFVKDFVYKNLSYEEKIQALESGVYGKNLQKEKRELIISQLTFQKNLTDFTKNLSNFNSLLNNLGIKDPKLSKAVQLAGVAESAILNYMSGNYLGAAVSVSSLFSKQNDVAGERHKQIMDMLGRMDKKLNALLEGQKNIIELQLNTIEMIKALNVRLDTIDNGLDQILYTTNLNRLALNRLLQVPRENCSQFLITLEDDLRTRVGFDDFTTSFITPFMVRTEHFSNYSKQFEQCEDLTNQLASLRTGGSIHETLLLSHADNELSNDKGRISYLTDVYPKIAELLNVVLNHKVNTNEERFQRLKTLMVLGLEDYSDPRLLMKRYNFLAKTPEGQAEVNELFKGPYLSLISTNESNIIRMLSKPISINSVLQLSPIINEVYYYFDIVNSGELQSMQQILNSHGKGKNSKGYLILKDLYNVLTLAQIQANLENGNLLLPYIYENFNDKNIRTSLVKTIKSAQHHNKKLEQNFLMFNLLVSQSTAKTASGKNQKPLYDLIGNSFLKPTNQVKSFDFELNKIFNAVGRDEAIAEINRISGMNQTSYQQIAYSNENNVETAVVSISLDDEVVSKSKSKFSIKLEALTPKVSSDIWKRIHYSRELSDARLESLRNLFGYELEQDIYNKNKSKANQYLYKKNIYKSVMLLNQEN